MKKIIMTSLCLGLAATVMLAACGKKDETKTNENEQTPVVEDTVIEENVPEIVIPEEQADYEVKIDSFDLTATIAEYKGDAEQVVIPATVVDPQYGDVCPVVAIGGSAFLGNETVKEISFPDTLTKIEEGAFQNCTALEKVTLPEGFEEIGAKAFYNSALKEINIPSTVKKIGQFAFSTQLNETPWYASQKAAQVIVGDGILLKNNAQGDVTLPEEVKSIAYYAFTNPGAVKVTLGSAVENVDAMAIFEADGKNELVFAAPYQSVTAETLSLTQFKYEEFGAPEVEVVETVEDAAEGTEAVAE